LTTMVETSKNTYKDTTNKMKEKRNRKQDDRALFLRMGEARLDENGKGGGEKHPKQIRKKKKDLRDWTVDKRDSFGGVILLLKQVKGQRQNVRRRKDIAFFGKIYINRGGGPIASNTKKERELFGAYNLLRTRKSDDKKRGGKVGFSKNPWSIQRSTRGYRWRWGLNCTWRRYLGNFMQEQRTGRTDQLTIRQPERGEDLNSPHRHTEEGQ